MNKTPWPQMSMNLAVRRLDGLLFEPWRWDQDGAQLGLFDMVRAMVQQTLRLVGGEGRRPNVYPTPRGQVATRATTEESGWIGNLWNWIRSKLIRGSSECRRLSRW